jgi:hypothetical protein
MWLITRYGLFSIVCAHLPENRTRQRRMRFAEPEPDRDTLMIRARNVQHLEALRDRFPGLRTYPTHTNTGTDYPVRLIVPKEFVTGMLAELATEIDYSNFKNAVKHERPQDWDYQEFCSEVWGAGLDLEKADPVKLKPGKRNRVRVKPLRPLKFDPSHELPPGHEALNHLVVRESKEFKPTGDAVTAFDDFWNGFDELNLGERPSEPSDDLDADLAELSDRAPELATVPPEPTAPDPAAPPVDKKI